jgi:hypothetical protein
VLLGNLQSEIRNDDLARAAPATPARFEISMISQEIDKLIAAGADLTNYETSPFIVFLLTIPSRVRGGAGWGGWGGERVREHGKLGALCLAVHASHITACHPLVMHTPSCTPKSTG